MDAPKRIVRLLVVDDDKEFLAATAQALSRRGFDVSTAASGSAAADLVFREEYDIVVLDLRMPDLDGVGVFRRIKAIRPHLPVIILTGYGSATDAIRAIQAGVTDYLVKPCDVEELAEHIRSAVGAKSAAGAGGDESMPNEAIEVLLVDDDVELVEALSPVLRRRGMMVSTAAGGEEAIRVLKDSRVDVILLDLKMSGIDGLTALRRFKELLTDVEVIIMTGYPSAESALQAVRAGAGEYIMKPPDIDELVGAIQRAFRRRHQNLEQRQRPLTEELRNQHRD